jgi:hypothetical protein
MVMMHFTKCEADDAAQHLTPFIKSARVMMGVAPVNTQKDLHRRASLKCRETEALSADAVTVFLLEP